MRFSELLEFKNLSKNPTTEDDIFEVFDRIKIECSDFLNMIKGSRKLLWRGAYETADVFEDFTKPRRAIGSSQEWVTIYNELLAIKGIKANRSNSISVTPYMNHASRFGNQVYMIFPKNGFEWSSQETNDVGGTRYESEGPSQRTTLIPDTAKVEAEFGVKMKPGRTFDFLASNLGLVYPESLDYIDREASYAALDAAFKPQNTNMLYALDNSFEISINGTYYAIVSDWYDYLNFIYQF